MTEKPRINQLFTLLKQHEEAGRKALMMPRRTDAYTTGDQLIDEYIGGGYGRREGGYEILMIFGGTGVSKSTFATQLILHPALQGKRIAYYSLEDDPTDLWTRIYYQASGLAQGKFGEVDELMEKIGRQVMVAPESDGYTLGQMAQQIEDWFVAGVDIVVVDPLQFVFEASVDERADTEFNRQRKFMRQVNNLVKRSSRETGKGKTVILVSHTNKGKFEDAIDTIMGSGANKQVPTKIIQILRDDQGRRYLNMVKSRFTEHRIGMHQIELDSETMLLRTASVPPDYKNRPDQWYKVVREAWDKKGK